jgi:hypothetical protein
VPEMIKISGFHIDIGELILCCPKVCHCWGLSTIRVHSRTSENISIDHRRVGDIDILAPLLKPLRMCGYTDTNFSVSFSVPMLKNLNLWCSCLFQNVGIGEVWRLCYMKLGIEKSVYILYLSIYAPVLMLYSVQNLSQFYFTPTFTDPTFWHLGPIDAHVGHQVASIWISFLGTSARAKCPHICLYSDLFLDLLQGNFYTMPHHFYWGACKCSRLWFMWFMLETQSLYTILKLCFPRDWWYWRLWILCGCNESMVSSPNCIPATSTHFLITHLC